MRHCRLKKIGTSSARRQRALHAPDITDTLYVVHEINSKRYLGLGGVIAGYTSEVTAGAFLAMSAPNLPESWSGEVEQISLRDWASRGKRCVLVDGVLIFLSVPAAPSESMILESIGPDYRDEDYASDLQSEWEAVAA